MKKSSSSSLVRRSKWQAPNALGASVVRNRSRLCCRQQRVVEHAGQMSHACERRQLRADPLQQVRDLGLVADIGREDVDAGTGSAR